MSESPIPTAIGDFDAIALGGNNYLLYLKTPMYVEQTGAKITTQLRLPAPHILKRASIKHTDSSDAESIDALAYAIRHRMLPGKNFTVTLRYGAVVVASDTVEIFGKEYISDETIYILETNTTATDRIYFSMVIEVLE